MPVQNLLLLLSALIIFIGLLNYLISNEKYQLPIDFVSKDGIIFYGKIGEIIKFRNKQIILKDNFNFNPKKIYISPKFLLVIETKDGKLKFINDENYKIINFDSINKFFISPINQISNDIKIYFDIGKSKSEFNNQNLIFLLSKSLKTKNKINIYGYASVEGEQNGFDNLRLSKQRANFVKDQVTQLHNNDDIFECISGKGVLRIENYKNARIVKVFI